MLKFNSTTGEFDVVVDNIEDGTVVGQLAYWNGTKWVAVSIDGLFWNNATKQFDFGGDVTIKVGQKLVFDYGE